jgi:hypothetical protein
MKQQKISKLTLVRNKFNQDLLYTSPEWPTKEIDGVQFVSVKVRPQDSYLKLIRKDQIEKVKQ